MSIKYSACVVLFNPTKKDIDRLYEYKKIFDFLLLFDNTEDVNFKNQDISNEKNISYFGDGHNYGLAYAYQYAFQWALHKKTDYLCTLDQDSEFCKDDICNIRKFIEENSFSVSNAAIIAPRVRYDKNIGIKRFRTYDKVNWVISSGSFINIQLFTNNNVRFDKNYFIDCIDKDVCMQIKRQGLDILQYNNSILNQSLGDANGCIQTNHMPLRHYYIFRNRLYFNGKYYKGLKRMMINLLQSVKHIFLIIRYENNKREKIKYCYRGYLDYKANTMGKAVYEK